MAGTLSRGKRWRKVRNKTLAEKAKAYVRRDFRPDIVAGLTVTVVALPQSMAYAIIAGVPPAYGLYTSIVSGLVGSLLGSSSHLITGPTNATALMFAATLAAYDGDISGAELVVLYTFMIGVLKLIFGAAGFGGLVRYVSDAVIIGFLAGAGCLIVGNQIEPFFGIEVASTQGQPFLLRMVEILGHTVEANPYTVGLSVGTVVIVLLADRINKNLPGALIAFGVGGLLVYALGLDARGVATIGSISSIPRALPPFQMVHFDYGAMEALMPSAIALAVVGLMEVTAISKATARLSGQHLEPNREFAAQGISNIVGAFFLNFASSGSLGRTLANYYSGAHTRVAGILSALFTAAVLLAFGPLGEYIPLGCLAGFLMVLAIQMVRLDRIRQAMRAGRESAIVLVMTLAATLVLRIDYAIYLGVGLSLVFFVRRSSALRIGLLVPTPGKSFRQVPLSGDELAKLRGEVVIINIVGAMYFAVMEEFVGLISQVRDLKPRAVILRIRRVSNIDSSGLEVLEEFHREMSAQGVPLFLCGVDKWMMRVLRKSGLASKIGVTRVVVSDELMFNSMERTLELAEAAAEHYEKHGTKEPEAPGE